MASFGGVSLSAEQLANAQTITSVGRTRGASDRDIAIAIATAMQESGLRNLNSGDRDSLGLFQQRPSQGWGSAAQVRDPYYAAGKFFDALAGVTNRDSLSLAAAAQKVQRSGLPGAYAKWEQMATALVGGGRSDPASGVGPMPSMLTANGQIDSQAAIGEYGFIASLADSVPDIKRVLQDAVAGQWTPDRFTAALQNTAWFRNTNARKREMDRIKATEPGEYQRQRDKAINDIWAMGTQLGAKLDDKRVGELAEYYLNLGWSNDELRRALSSDIHVDGSMPTGLTAATLAQLKDEASQYMVQMPPDQLQQWTRDILSGSVPEDSFHAFLVGQAKAQFPPMAAALDSGVTVRQYLDPYKQMAAQTLEVPPESVDLNDPTYRNPIIQQDAQGNRGVVSLTDYQTYLKSLPGYRKTRQANEGSATLVNSLLKTFGKVAP